MHAYTFPRPNYKILDNVLYINKSRKALGEPLDMSKGPRRVFLGPYQCPSTRQILEVIDMSAIN